MITKTEGTALRAIAIIGIILHNYCHWLGFAVKENEYTFDIDKSREMLRVITIIDEKWLIHMLSFWGHYGVPVFLFLSGYGLMLKYNSSAPFTLKTSTFIKLHFLKLFRMMIVGFTSFILIDAITPGRHHYHTIDILGQIFMFNNVLPQPDDVIWPGPYWFFGLMMQLYILYQVLLKHCNTAVLSSLVVICFLLQVVCSPTGDILNSLRYNFVGGLLPFVLGMLWQTHQPLLKSPNKAVYTIMMLISAFIVFAASFNFTLWLFAPLFVCTCAIGFIKTIPSLLVNNLSKMGNISAALFVAHPITRKILIPISRHDEVYTGLLLYIITTIALAWLFQEIIKRIPIKIS